jgi:glyoxylase-like metal-dependent hydrolase (beta-lactamase superfamily II)
VGAGEPVSVRRLTTGVARTRRASRGALRYVLDDWEDSTLPVNAYLVRHPLENVLFDAGQTAEAARPGYFPAWHPWLRLARFELEPSDEVAAQLERLGVPPASVGQIVLSHLHTDHVGGLAAFPGAEVIVSETEWRRAHGARGRLRGYVRLPGRLQARTVGPAGPPLGPFSASHDLLGDGTLTLVPTPGHTPGHLAMLVRGTGRTWLLAGDLAHDRDELGRTRPEIARWCDAEGIELLTAHDVAAPVDDGP